MSTQPSTNLWRESLWDYSVRVFAHKDVEPIVLGLQDDYHANVDIILWCCWLEQERICLSKEALDEVLISIDTINQETLIKLREVRNHLKNAGTFTAVQAKVVSKQLVNAELMIEKVLISRLQDLTRRFAYLMKDPNDPLGLEYYLSFMMIPDASKTSNLIRCGTRSARRVSIAE
ncbi:TIGR02444 family protein [Teredinibacter haidensis]|uniref:TIGR02444 family protein n=1 Tax=Teredinibacter haidensis TaxID=2731755 RepID=UPI0009490608|nr:TIGR02444 family protein [Teredinibacter haidensis]